VATDWSPVWSADGRWLYFVSDRGGGAMNLWRVAIDQSTGSASGAPEQVTNGTQDLGYVKISADGKRMVVAGNDNTYDLSVYDFDPAHPERLAPRRVLRNQALQWCRLSPDGLWLSCTSRGSAEDLVLLRTDGSETRRLTDDTFKDRLPIWLNDSRTLHFKSTRSGSWEHWSIRADGSDLRRLSNFGGDFQVAAVSPDGRDWLLSSDDLKTLSYRYDGTGIATRAKATLLPLQSFAPLDFSPDMAFASGYVTDAAGNATTAAILTRASNELRTVPVRLNPLTLSGTWLPSSRAFVIGGRIKDGAGLIIVDAATGAVRLLKAGSLDDSCVLSADGRTLLIQHPVHEADVWLMEKVSK
jgi:Tol biopolymer transport system component